MNRFEKIMLCLVIASAASALRAVIMGAPTIIAEVSFVFGATCFVMGRLK